MSTGVSGVPVVWLVAGSVVWYWNVPATLGLGAMDTPRAGAAPVLTTVANAVAVPPTRTERLLGSTADARALGGLNHWYRIDSAGLFRQDCDRFGKLLFGKITSTYPYALASTDIVVKAVCSAMASSIASYAIA